MSGPQITSPDHPALAELCAKLAVGAGAIEETGEWPAEQLRLCGEYGVYRWFAGSEWGGLAWDEEQIVRGYLALSGACLTTAFILTQREGACQRLETTANRPLSERLLPGLTAGNLFATIGISHLTTSRRHIGRPVLSARRTEGGYVLDGYSAWVTGAPHADYVLVGATVVEGEKETGQQILAAVPTSLPGVSAATPSQLLALSASHTGKLELESVDVADEWLIAGPAENVLSRGEGGGTGGLQTSTLALGLSTAAIRYLGQEAARRAELVPAFEALAAERDSLEGSLLASVRGEPKCSNDDLRQRANSLVLRGTQAALAAAKGAGFVVGHPAGRLCRQALFFLVWSCPAPVLAASLCELAGIQD